MADGTGEMTTITQRLSRALAVLLSALTVIASFAAGVILTPGHQTPKPADLSRTAMIADGISPSLIARAEAATLDGQAPYSPAAADITPDDVTQNPGVLDQLFTQRENDRVTLNSIELSWMLAAGQELQSKGVNLYSSTETKWKIGVALQVLDPDSTKRHMTTDARYVPSAEDNHYEVPPEAERTSDVKQRIEDTKKLYVALGRIAGLDESKSEQVYTTGLRWALGQKATCAPSNGGGNGKLEGNSNLEKIYSWLMTGPGYTPEQASGIVANIKHESGGDPTASNGSFSPNTAWGVAQWFQARHWKLRDEVKAQLGDKFYVGDKSNPPASEVLTPEEMDKLLVFQLEYLQRELESPSYKYIDTAIRAVSTPEEAAAIWCREFERPGNYGFEVPRRQKAATEWYAAHQGQSAPSTDSGSSGGSDSGSIAPKTSSNISLYGDSLSVGIISKWIGKTVDGAWTSDQAGNSGNSYRGGWAKVGATSAAVADNAKPVDGADVAVVMAGTNDQGSWGSGGQGPVGNVERALKATGQSNLVVAAVAPSDANGAGSKTYNDALKQMADRNSWRFVDPWTELRADDGRYKDEYRADGIHPNDAGYQKAADALSAQISSGNKTVAQTCSPSGSGDAGGQAPQFVGDIAMPLAVMIRGSNYGARVHPITGQLRFHYGTDYPVPTGTATFAIADGIVHSAGPLGTCGNAIEIFHNINGSQIATRYCHLSSMEVSAGDTVKKGQEIAKSGNTGGSTGPHLHFEVRTSWAFPNDWVTACNSVDSDAWLKAQGHS